MFSKYLLSESAETDALEGVPEDTPSSLVPSLPPPDLQHLNPSLLHIGDMPEVNVVQGGVDQAQFDTQGLPVSGYPTSYGQQLLISERQLRGTDGGL